MSIDDVRLAVICKACIKRLGVDERLLMPLTIVQTEKLPNYDSAQMKNLRYPAQTSVSQVVTKGPGGSTSIAYKVTQTVKEEVEDSKSRTGR